MDYLILALIGFVLVFWLAPRILHGNDYFIQRALVTCLVANTGAVMILHGLFSFIETLNG